VREVYTLVPRNYSSPSFQLTPVLHVDAAAVRARLRRYVAGHASAKDRT
jgi:hypothetical protein